MEITDLVKVGKSEQYKTYVDGEFVCKLEAEILVKYHVKIGGSLSQSEFDEIRQESEKLSCFNVALAYISKNVKTKKQVKENLKQKGYLSSSIDNAIDKLISYGYINDKYFAELYVKENKSKKGILYLKQSLAQKGVSESDIKQVFEEFETNIEDIKNIALKYMKNKTKDIQTKQKLYRHLLSKGFTYEDVKKATNSIFGGNNDWD